jgi:hypothetical protein
VKLSVVGAVLLALGLFGAGYLLGGRGSAHLRDAYRDSVAMDREAAQVSDSLADLQRLADSARVAEAAGAAGRAQGRAQASGAALPGLLPSVDTVLTLDSAGVVALRASLVAFGSALAGHLHDDSVAADSVSRLILVLREATSHALAEASEARAQRDRVVLQLAGAVTHLRAGHSVLFDVAIAGAGVLAGHLLP